MKGLYFLGFIFLLSTISVSAQSLGFSQVLVVKSTDGLQTVPSGKVWKIENVNGGSGQVTVTGAANAHCGTSCSGGVCSSSSCSYLGYIWELNGTPIDPVTGCFVCAGSACYNNISACPATHTFGISQLPEINTPFWLTAGNTLKVNATNVFFSIIEFNVVP